MASNIRSVKDIKSQIRDLKRSMKEAGTRVVSCFNGGLTSDESRDNTRLFQLKSDLQTAQKAELDAAEKSKCDKCEGPNDRAFEGNYCTKCREGYSKHLASLGHEYRPIGSK